MEKLSAESDIIVLHLPLLDATHHLVDDAFLAGCKRKPMIVNVSRGGLVDNDALIRALVGGLLHSMAWKASRSRQRSWSVGRMSK